MSQTETATDTATAPDSIDIIGAPRIRGLGFRRYRGPVDHPEMVRVANLVGEADHDPEVRTVEGITSHYAHLTNCDPYEDSLVVEVGDRMVAYSRVEWEDQTNGGRSYFSFGFIDPAWRRKGIGRVMLRWNERRLRAIAAGHVHDRPRWFGSWGNDINVGNQALLLAEGYVSVRHFYEMVRADLNVLPNVALPDGFEIRPIVNDADIRRVFAADGEAFRDHWGGVDESEEAYLRWTTSPTFDPSLLIVAWDGDEVAAGIINGIDPVTNERRGIQRGWLESVFTRRAWRRRGLARALIARSLALLRERGMTSASLGVDASNPHEAFRLYEDSGFIKGDGGTSFRKAFDPVVGPEW